MGRKQPTYCLSETAPHARGRALSLLATSWHAHEPTSRRNPGAFLERGPIKLRPDSLKHSLSQIRSTAKIHGWYYMAKGKEHPAQRGHIANTRHKHRRDPSGTACSSFPNPHTKKCVTSTKAKWRPLGTPFPNIVNPFLAPR